MTDRELLELAAKAAGVSAHWITYGTIQARPLFVVSVSGSMGAMPYEEEWNPLKNDVDALRLAVKLRLSIDHNPPAAQQPWVSAGRQGCEGRYDPVTCVEDEFDEPQRGTATRRAIVRAAAEIGRKQEAKAARRADSADGEQKGKQ